ncbi:DUF4184 family protein [Pontibacter sp. CAU 1760]
MPFTFSHPAIILPVHAVFRRWTSLTGLVVGSLSPDFEKFIRMSTHDPYSHTWRSIFYFNLPLGILLTFIFHLVVRDALLDNLPAFMSRRLSGFKKFDWVNYFKRNYLIVIFSVILGASSHIFWDSFTHVDGRAVRWFPVLMEKVTISGKKESLYGLLQLWTSVAGALLILFSILMLPPVHPLSRRRNLLSYWLTVMVVAGGVASFRLLFRLHHDWDIVFIVIAAALIGLVSAPIILKRHRFWNQ